MWVLLWKFLLSSVLILFTFLTILVTIGGAKELKEFLKKK